MTGSPYQGPPVSVSFAQGGSALPHQCDLSAFGTVLAGQLPGMWRREHLVFATFEDQLARAVWDSGPAHAARLDHELGHAALLHGAGGEELLVISRPGCPHQYLVAPLLPEGVQWHHLEGVEHPDGISVPDAPARAAAAIIRRVLPRYRRALAAVRRNMTNRPGAPDFSGVDEAAQLLTMVWGPDGSIAAPSASVPEDARSVLVSCNFEYRAGEAAYVLPRSPGSVQQALFLKAAIKRLTAQGIGVNHRRAAAPGPPRQPGLPRTPGLVHRR
ncbi:hypothetical protein [Streptomyces sp. NPDC001508]|uniref:hypothetical protein n=1 Tax=Streptomyces sp. NPDC001508 TaxID=3154656 RepID=UPI00332FDC1D